MQRRVRHTHTSWKSSNDFCGVKTFNKLIIWKTEERGEDQPAAVTVNTHTNLKGDTGVKLLQWPWRRTKEWVGTKEQGSTFGRGEGDTGEGKRVEHVAPQITFAPWSALWFTLRPIRCISGGVEFSPVTTSQSLPSVLQRGDLLKTENRQRLRNGLKLCFIQTLDTFWVPVLSVAPRMSHLHFCDWHISWAPTPGTPSWHGSGSGRVCSASWWPRFCPGQRHNQHCRGEDKFLYYVRLDEAIWNVIGHKNIFLRESKHPWK